MVSAMVMNETLSSRPNTRAATAKAMGTTMTVKQHQGDIDAIGILLARADPSCWPGTSGGTGAMDISTMPAFTAGSSGRKAISAIAAAGGMTSTARIAFSSSAGRRRT